MGRRLTGWLVVFMVALGAAVTPAQAKDRKSAAPRDREALLDMIAARQARPVAMRQEAVAATGAAPSATAAELSTSARNGRPIAPLQEQQAVRGNPFRFNIGAVAVQPAVGGIKGAQFSIGF